jgi:CDGSH-type Zn-finger protein
MAREITHEAQGPAALDEDDIAEQGGTAYICLCGLSDDKPFCDGSHSATADEEDGVVYKYEGDDNENPRHEIEEIVFADE